MDLQEPQVECSSCHEVKPESAFYFRNGKRHGRQCKTCQTKRHVEYHNNNRARHNENQRKSNRRLKAQAMEAYGGKCVCCGESELMFLSLDHINKDGGEHRKRANRESGGSYWYRQLRDEGWPNDPPLQVLCFNCNFASYWGTCPHKQQQEEA